MLNVTVTQHHHINNSVIPKKRIRIYAVRPPPIDCRDELRPGNWSQIKRKRKKKKMSAF